MLYLKTLLSLSAVSHFAVDSAGQHSSTLLFIFHRICRVHQITMSAAELRVIAETDVTQPLPADVTQVILTSAPFVYVPGTFNTRDVGLVPTPDGTPSKLRTGFVYRSGALNGLTGNGKSVIAEKLAVKKVFDLRSMEEHSRSPDPEIPGVENVWRSTGELAAHVEIADFIDGLGEKGYSKMYLEVLDLYQPIFTAVFEHVRDHPEEPFLFHCTGELSCCHPALRVPLASANARSRQRVGTAQVSYRACC